MDMRFAFAAAVCATVLCAAETSKTALDKSTFESYVRHLLLVDPRVQMNIDNPKASPVPGLDEVDVHLTFNGASQDHVFYVSKNGQEVVYGKMFNINKSPFQADLDKIKTDVSPSFGAAGAPLVIVMYADFQCPACKEEAKTLRENVVKNYPTQVRVYFKDFPLTQIHPWAKSAAIAGRCIFRQNATKFWDFYDWIYDHQTEITAENMKDKVLEFAKSKDLDTLQIARCIDNRSTEADIDKEMAEAKALNIDQTPTMFINGRRIPGAVPWQNLKPLLDAELEYQKSATEAAEKCCEIKIPTAVPASKP